MAAHAFAAYLPHFARDDGGRLRTVNDGRPDAAPVPERPVAELVTEAEERGRRRGAEEARAELEALRAADRAAFEKELAGERQKWTDETADRLAADLAAGFGEVQSAVVDGVAGVLRPFVGRLILDRSLDELAQTVAALLHDGRHMRVRVSGPAPLVDRLRPCLEPYQPIVEYSIGDGPDVSVALDNTVVATCVAAWTDLLQTAASGKANG